MIHSRELAEAWIASREHCTSSPGTRGEPLAGSTVNRFISTASGLYRYARRIRALPCSHIPPTREIEKAPEPTDPNKYFRPE